MKLVCRCEGSEIVIESQTRSREGLQDILVVDVWRGIRRAGLGILGERVRQLLSLLAGSGAGGVGVRNVGASTQLCGSLESSWQVRTAPLKNIESTNERLSC